MRDDMKLDPTRLKLLRESRGWSQEQLAEIACLNPRTVQRAEAGGKASLDTGMALASALGCALPALTASAADMPGSQASEQGPKRGDPLRFVLYAMVGVLMLMMFGYHVGKDMAKRDAQTCTRAPAAHSG